MLFHNELFMIGFVFLLYDAKIHIKFRYFNFILKKDIFLSKYFVDIKISYNFVLITN